MAGFGSGIRLIDRLCIGLYGVVVSFSRFVEDVPHLMHPAALMQNSGIADLKSGRQTRAAVGHNQLQALPDQPAPVQVLEHSFPGLLALAPRIQKAHLLPELPIWRRKSKQNEGGHNHS